MKKELLYSILLLAMKDDKTWFISEKSNAIFKEILIDNIKTSTSLTE